jgi:AcrR family transcriptional regulator
VAIAKPTRRPRRTAAERREQVLEAAIVEFGMHGIHGTTGAAIAKRADLTQPHLFHLFGSKRNLFLATIDYGFDRAQEAFEAALDAAPDGAPVLDTLDRTYGIGLERHYELMTQLNVWAACDDADVRKVARQRFLDLYRWVEERSGAPEAEVRSFFAYQLLCNVLTAMRLGEADRDDELAGRLAHVEGLWPRDRAAGGT